MEMGSDVASPGYDVTLLRDDASLWPGVDRVLPSMAVDSGAVVIGLICWTCANSLELEKLPDLRAKHPGPLVAVLAEAPSALGARTIISRLEGAVLARDIDRALLPTLAAVAAGQCVMPAAIRRSVERPRLSPRERQILAMVVLGCSNAEIAGRLVVSESTIKNHLSSAFAKLGVSSRGAATELILDEQAGLGLGILRISPEESLP